MKVNIFFRRRLPGYSSIEEVFNTVIQDSSVGYSVKSLPEKRINLFGLLKNLRYAFRNRSKINHITGDVHYIAFATGRNTVLTIHDSYSLLTGSWVRCLFLKLFWFWLPALIVKKISTISEKSKRELEEIIPFAKNKIHVIPNPYNPQLLTGDIEMDESLISDTAQPIILHIGTKPNKNLERLIEAMEGLPYKLYIIGKLTPLQAELLSKYKIRFKSFFNLPYHEVAMLYHQCSMVCFASLYEGFGMPIIEGQLVGKPVLTSDIEPMPWVAGPGGAHFVDPYDVEAIRKGIVKILEEDDYRQKLVSGGLENVKRFEPKKIAGMYEELYKEIAGV